MIDKNEIVTFVSSCSIKESIESTYNEIVSEIKQRFPDVSTIHIGSSSVDDLLTKGDLDILVIANSWIETPNNWFYNRYTFFVQNAFWRLGASIATPLTRRKLKVAQVIFDNLHID